MSAESRSERTPRLRSAESWVDEDESGGLEQAPRRGAESGREARERARKDADEFEARPRRPAWRSPLTLRILAINVLVLAIPVLGLLHLGQYRQSLIAAELDALILQGRTFTLPLANSAVSVSDSGKESLEAEPTRQLMRVLLTTDRLRARVFDRSGAMLADSNLLTGPGGTVEVRELPGPNERNLGERLERVPESLLEWLPGQGELPLYREPRQPTASDYPEVEQALQGNAAGRARSDIRGRLVLSAAVPVQRYRQVLGALMLSKDGAEIAAAVADRRRDVLMVFAIGFAVTVLLSLYLAGTIARPIRHLAEAAEAVRYGKGRRIRIPDLTKRADEIGDLSGALIEMTEALWQRLDAIEGFAADVAHEIKNPLTSLRSAVETAARIQDLEQQKKLMSIILDDVARLDRLISDISDASRLDAELSRAQTGPVDVARLVHALADVDSATGAFGKPRLVIDLPAHQELFVAGIEDRLGQVLRNLISNAATFSPPGGRIELAARREGPSVVMTVSDQGPGIPAGKENAIFERFYSERPKDEKFGTHSGLGLSISRQIVEAHGGTIHAENRRKADGGSAGARFVIRLPYGGES